MELVFYNFFGEEKKLISVDGYADKPATVSRLSMPTRRPDAPFAETVTYKIFGKPYCVVLDSQLQQKLEEFYTNKLKAILVEDAQSDGDL